MSALGQKRTCAAHKPMSALPPSSDIDCVFRHVCFGPIADISRSLDHLVGTLLELQGHDEA